MRTPVRAAGRVGAALTAALAAVLLPAPGLPAAAGAAEPCVGVIVDARLLGGTVTTGCATGDPDSGLDALTRAGFRYAFVPRQPGLVCQIDGAPACEDTGSTTYWSYWHRADGSATWTYSSAGAGSHDPEPGSTEAWVWQDGGRREPPDVALGTICPQVATARTGRASSSGPSASPAPARTSRSVPAATSGREKTGTTGTTGQAAPGPSTPEPAAPAATSAPATAAAGDGDGDGDGEDRTPWTGVVLGGGLVAALGAAALTRSRRPGGSP